MGTHHNMFCIRIIKSYGTNSYKPGHNSQYGYAKGITLFRGLRAGTTYTFTSTDKSGRTGGFMNGLITAIAL